MRTLWLILAVIFFSTLLSCSIAVSVVIANWRDIHSRQQYALYVRILLLLLALNLLYSALR